MAGELLSVTVLLPCLDESRTIEACVRAAREGLEACGQPGEVLVADNGSRDGSQDVARRAGARVVTVARRGYGAALRGGIAAARGQRVVMADSDGSYDLRHVPRVVAALDAGAEIVLGNRFRGGIAPGAMPWLHRWVGNPVLSCVGRAVSGAAVGDFHCGLRGVRRDDVLRLGLRADGMEFASEMILTAAAHGLRIVEVPTTLAPDGRDRPPHLRTWRDGWRHLRLLLLLAPRWLFLYPGGAAAVAGGLLVATLAPGPVRVGGVMFDVHTMLLGAALLAVGLQGVLLAVIAEAYGAAVGLWPTSSSRRALLDGWSVERGLIAGGALVTAGVGVALAETMWWADAGFGPLDVFRRDLILAVVAMVTGSQVASAGFLVGLARLGLERMDEPGPPPWAEWTPDERG